MIALAIAAAAIPPGAPAVQHRPADGSLVVPELEVVAGTSHVHGSGPLRRFKIEAQRGLDIDRKRFAAAVEKILFHRRGWLGPGSRISLQRVDADPVNFRVTLAGPRMVDRLCHPLRTRGRVSCENRGRAVINYLRWRTGSYPWGRDLGSYRRYLINHEVGHSLGHRHRRCVAGRIAPVMLQQTGGAGACRHSGWPLRFERKTTRPPWWQYPAAAVPAR